MKLASPSGKSLLEERLEEKQNGALTAPPLNINGVGKVSLYVMLVYLRLPYLSWIFRRPCFGQMVPPSSPSCSPRAADTALQPNETLFDVLTLTEPYSEANFMFVALSFLISFSEAPVSAGPSSHDPTGNLLLPTTPDKPYLLTLNMRRMGEALLTEHAGFFMLFRIVLIPPLSKALPNSLAVLSLKKVSCCQEGPDSDSAQLLLNANGGSE